MSLYAPATSLIDLDETFLPVGHMRQLSRVTCCEDSAISAEIDLGPEHWVWAEHFPGDPIFPGTLMLEAAGQLVAAWAWANGERGRPRLLRISGNFSHPVVPEASVLLLKGVVQRRRQIFLAEVQLSCRDVAVAQAEVALVVLPSRMDKRSPG